MEIDATARQLLTTATSPTARERARRRPALATFFAVIVTVQGVHLVEHLIQLAQVHLLGVPEDDALGLLGWVFELDGTEEWLHLVFNALFLASLWILAGPLVRGALGAVPVWALVVFVVAGLGLETWHTFEHSVIIRNVVRNDGCPCPGIVDQALGISDTTLHFFYNALAYAATVVPYSFVRRHRSHDARQFFVMLKLTLARRLRARTGVL